MVSLMIVNSLCSLIHNVIDVDHPRPERLIYEAPFSLSLYKLDVKLLSLVFHACPIRGIDRTSSTSGCHTGSGNLGPGVQCCTFILPLNCPAFYTEFLN
jgi:hypothetical protein